MIPLSAVRDARIWQSVPPGILRIPAAVAPLQLQAAKPDVPVLCQSTPQALNQTLLPPTDNRFYVKRPARKRRRLRSSGRFLPLK